VQEVILFIFLDQEDYTSDHRIISVIELEESVKEKIKTLNDVEYRFLKLTEAECDKLYYTSLPTFPSQIIDQIYVELE
jgi:hypothetical protein